MSSVTGITDIKRRFLQGKGFIRPFLPGANGTLTAAGATSGHLGSSLNSNSIGTTFPATIVGFQTPAGSNPLLATGYELGINSLECGWIGWYYRLGTADLTSTTGNRFTHDGTFTRLTRTRGGVAMQNISMIPLIYVTAAASVTQLAYTFSYADQDGNATTGSLTNNFPAATTNAQSLYNMMMDDGDCAVQDITAITVSTATTGATANIYGFEPLEFFQTPIANWSSFVDGVYGGTNLIDLRPATPDSGSVTQQFLSLYIPSNFGSSTSNSFIYGFDNS